MTLDLMGKTFGRLVVLECRTEIHSPGDQEKLYLCRCDSELGGCGKEKWITRKNLISGSTKSCGCLRRERYYKMNQEKIIDLTGQRFGSLLVLGRGEDHINKQGSRELRWLCKCERCGKEKNIQTWSLKKIKKLGSLGCSSCSQKDKVKTRAYKKLVDLTGKIYGKLIVMRRDDDYITPKGQHCPTWLCKCECGNTTIVTGSDLRRKDGKSQRSCGCTRFESSIAIELKEYLVENYSAIPEYREFKNPTTNRYLPYDVYIPDYCFYIEVNGLQHYIDSGWFGNAEKFETRQHKDRLKREYAEQHGTYIEIDLRKIKTTQEAIDYVEERLERLSLG